MSRRIPQSFRFRPIDELFARQTASNVVSGLFDQAAQAIAQRDPTASQARFVEMFQQPPPSRRQAPRRARNQPSGSETMRRFVSTSIQPNRPEGYSYRIDEPGVYNVSTGSRDGFLQFMADHAPPNSRYRILLKDINRPGGRVMGGTGSLRTPEPTGSRERDYNPLEGDVVAGSDLHNSRNRTAAIKELFESLEKARKGWYENRILASYSWGETYIDDDEIVSPWDMLSRFDLTVIFMDGVGRCNKNQVGRVIVNDMVLMSLVSRDNNCGLACIRHLMGDDCFLAAVNAKRDNPVGMARVYMALRNQLKMKGGLTAEQLQTVCEHLGCWQEGMIHTGGEVHENTRIVLHGSHWYIYAGQDGMVQCDCGKWHRSTSEHTCNAKRKRFFQEEVREIPTEFELITWDIETRPDVAKPKVVWNHDEKGRPIDKSNSYYQVATCLSWYDGKEPQNLLGTDCIDKFLDWLAVEASWGIHKTLISHNGSRFDHFWILERIMARDPAFDISKQVLVKGTQILSISWRGHEFRDSMKHLPSSLEKLSKDFKVQCPKIKSVVVDGKEIGSMELCTMRNHLGPREYLASLSDDERRGYIEYCNVDCISLYQVWDTYQKTMATAFRKINLAFLKPELIPKYQAACESNDLDALEELKWKVRINEASIVKLLRSVTCPGMMFSLTKIVNKRHILKKTYTKKEKKHGITRTGKWWVPDDMEMYDFICKAKLGGISYVGFAGKHNYDVSCVDVTSLYPCHMETGYFPAGKPEWTDTYIDGKLGIYHVKNVRAPENLPIGAIPSRSDDGLDWTAKFIEETHVTSIDLYTMSQLGYKLEIVRGLFWREWWNPFTEIIETFREIKMGEDAKKGTPEYNQALRECVKIGMNSLYGKTIESAKAFQYRSLTREELATIDWKTEDGEELHYKQGRWILKQVADKKLCPLQFGVFILAQSRRMMQRYMDIIGRSWVLASETDSLYFPTSRLKYLEASKDKVYRLGKNFGNMNLENKKITQGMWLEKKCYTYVDDEGKRAYTWKGVPGKYRQNLDAYEKLYETGKVEFKDVTMFKRDLFGGNQRMGISIGSVTKTIKASREYTQYDNLGWHVLANGLKSRA